MNKSCLNHFASEKVQPLVGEIGWAENFQTNSKELGL